VKSPNAPRSRRAGLILRAFSAAVPASAALLSTLVFERAALAQKTAVLTGTVVDAGTKRPLEDAVVTATSPSIPGEQIVVTDAKGTYRIPNLPPGDYTLRVEKEAYRAFVSGVVAVRAASSIRRDVEMLRESLPSEEIVIVIDDSMIDDRSSNTGVIIGRDFSNRLPLLAPVGRGAASRSFEGLAEVAPGAQADRYGISMSGTTSPENAFLIDGLSVNDPALGSLGTPLSVEFIEEVNIITGGYMPEYGRATGGILDVVTRSGSNQLRGSVFFNITPGALEGERARIQREGTSIRTDPHLSSVRDFGAEVGGPIREDKLWFYAGVDFAFTRTRLERSLHEFELTDDGTPRRDDKGLAVTRLIQGTERTDYADERALQYIGKLTYRINEYNRLNLSVYGATATSGGDGVYGYENTGQVERENLVGPYGATAHRYVASANDVSLSYWSAAQNKRLQLDATLGFHHQRGATLPADGSAIDSKVGLAETSHVVYRRSSPSPHAITELERVPAGRCAPKQVPNPADPKNPTIAQSCPVEQYELGGPGFIQDGALNRYQAKAKLTGLFRALGHHVFKAGVDVAVMEYLNTRAISGGAELRESDDGRSFHEELQSAFLSGPDQIVLRGAEHVVSRSTEVGGFLQDSFSILDKVTLNAGLRYDAQVLFNGQGEIGMALPNQWSPRVALIYDITRAGRSKLYASFARFHESVPLQIADQRFSPGGGATSEHDAATCDPQDPAQRREQCRSAGNLLPGEPRFSPNRVWRAGRDKAAVDPDLSAQSSDEIELGGELEMFPGGRVGLSYTKRYMNNVVEDMSRDGGNTSFIGNPGRGIARNFPEATRDYDALSVYFQKSLSGSWLAHASYTLSYLRGNYAGLFRPETGQFLPNSNSDFDLRTLLPNREGPLPGDSTHQIKVYAAKDFRLPGQMNLDLGLAFRTRSGRPQSYLGSHPTYGLNEVYILPRGARGRGPWIHGFDAHVGYQIELRRGSALTISMDVFNLFNFQGATRLDETYTTADVLPIPDGTTADLKDPKKLRRANGSPFDPNARNPHFGKPMEYQAPRQLRFGARVTF
jgi:hypothetical protein